MKPIIVIPVYNEVSNVEKMIRHIFDDIFANKDISILVVDSASPDGTGEVVEKLLNEYPNLFLFKQEKKKGLASAYIDGFRYAEDKGFDCFVEMDCDFQHPPELLPVLLDKIRNCDVVVASRYISDGEWEEKGNKNPLKRLISEFGNFYTSFVLHCPVSDMTGGFNVWTKQALDAIDLNRIIAKGYLFQIEMKYYAYKNHLKIEEVPFKFAKRNADKSKISLAIILEAFIFIWKLKRYKK